MQNKYRTIKIFYWSSGFPFFFLANYCFPICNTIFPCLLFIGNWLCAWLPQLCPGQKERERGIRMDLIGKFKHHLQAMRFQITGYQISDFVTKGFRTELELIYIKYLRVVPRGIMIHKSLNEELQHSLTQIFTRLQESLQCIYGRGWGIPAMVDLHSLLSSCQPRFPACSSVPVQCSHPYRLVYN